MANDRKNSILLSVGLLCISGGGLIRIFLSPLNDRMSFFDGFLNGLGLVFILYAFNAIKKRQAALRGRI